MKKKILYISHMYPSNYDYSYGKVIHEQAISLKKRGYEIKVICPVPFVPIFLSKFMKKYSSINAIPKKEKIEGIEVIYPRYISFPKASFFQYSGLLMFLGIKKEIKRLKKSYNFDLIHAHFTLPDAYAAMKISKLYKVPLITTIQASDLDITLKKDGELKQQIMETLEFSEEVITPTPRLRKQLLNSLNIHSKTIGYGIDPLKLELKKSKKLVDEYKNKVVIMSISRLIKTKGLNYNLIALKELVKKNSNLYYLIIGEGPEKNVLIELANELGISKNVEFIGQLTSEETMEYITIAEVFSLPSWQETFGLVYLEAMGSVKPVIGCENQGFDGIIKHKENGYLAPMHDVGALVEIIEEILNNPKQVEEISQNARNTVINEYTFDIIASKIDEIYENVD